ncbi:MAG: peptide chain release factor N(5)-glutamine methyltransferase [Alkalispirochaeta sp.]
MPDPLPSHIPLGALRDRIAAELTSSESAHLDALILVETVTGRDRADLLAELRTPVSEIMDDGVLTRLAALVEQRRRGVSIAYLTGTKQFYGYEFQVGPGVLVPRPESEHLVEEGLQLLHTVAHACIHDCCTGSGCVGISIARERASRGYTTEIVLSDLEPAALRWATRNAEHLLGGIAEVQFAVQRCDLLKPLASDSSETTGPWDLITANPPYLTAAEMERVIAHGWTEPASALDGGPDGLVAYAELAVQAFAQLRYERYVLVEHGWTQGSAVRDLFAHAGFDYVDTAADLAGRDRLVRARRPADTL